MSEIKSTQIWLFRMLLAIVLIAAGGGVVKGQRVYAPILITATGASLNVTNAANAALSDESVATLTSTSGFGQAIVQVAFANTTNPIAAGTTVYVKVGGSTTNITAAAYAGANGATTVGTAVSPANTTVIPTFFPDGSIVLAISATVPFNSVRLTLPGSLLGGFTATMSYAFYEGPDLGCAQVISTSWVGSLGGSVANPQSAIDGNINTYSTLGPGALLSYVDQTFYFPGLSSTSDEVKLTLSSPPTVLSVGLLNNVTISAYKGNSSTVLWSAGLGSVLSLDLLGLLGNGTPITISVAPNVQFDRIVVHFGSVLNLFSNLYIREIDRTPASPTFTTQNATICSGNTATLVATSPPAGYENRWYGVPAGGTALSNLNSFTSPTLTTTTTYYVARAKIGCPNESLRIPAIVTVNPLPVVAPITPATVTSVCVGQTINLTTTATGGLWKSSDPSKATVSQTGVVTGVAGGAITITYEITNANGCTGIASLPVTINPLPVVAAITGTPSVCIGKTTLLNTVTTGGTWSSATPGIATVDATGLVTGVAAGTSIITYTVTNANGCIGTASATVTVNPLPVINPITGTLAVCVGKTTALTSTTTGGQWTSGTQSAATVDVNTGIVTGVSVGTSTITYTVTNANGCISTLTATVTVNPLPLVSPIDGTLAACVGKTTALSSTTPGGQWSSGTLSIATVDANTGIVTGVAAGTSTITYTITNANGCTNTRTASVTINALPTVAAISGPTAICIGQNTTLSSVTSGGTWTSSDPAKATINAITGLVTSVAPGTTTITYSVNNANGCTGTASATFTVNPLPVVAAITGTNSICANQTTTLSSTTTGGQWSSSDPTKATINSTTGVLTGVAPGNTTITYKITDAITGCSNLVTALITIKLVPVLTSALNPAICSNVAFAYTATSNGLPGTTITWTRALVANISNPPASGTNTINETLINTTMSPVNVTYIFTVTLNGCSSTSNVILKVNPKPGPPHIVSQ